MRIKIFHQGLEILHNYIFCTFRVPRNPKGNIFKKNNYLRFLYVTVLQRSMPPVDTPPGTSDEHLSLASFFKQSGGCGHAVPPSRCRPITEYRNRSALFYLAPARQPHIMHSLTAQSRSKFKWRGAFRDFIKATRIPPPGRQGVQPRS